MKKLFIVLAVASLGFVACNSESSDKPAEDTTATKAPETPAMPDSTTMATPDSTGADTTAH